MRFFFSPFSENSNTQLGPLGDSLLPQPPLPVGLEGWTEDPVLANEDIPHPHLPH